MHLDRQHLDSETPPVGLRPQWPVIMRFPNFLVGQAGSFVASPRTVVNQRTVEPKREEGTGHSLVPEEVPAEEVPEAVPEEGPEGVPEGVDVVIVTEGSNPEEVAKHQTLDHLNEN